MQIPSQKLLVDVSSISLKGPVGPTPEVVVENETQQILRRILERFGPNGEMWCQGTSRQGQSVCTLQSVADVLGVGIGQTNDTEARRFLIRAARETPAGAMFRQYPDLVTPHGEHHTDLMLNESAKSFAEVRAMFLRAISLASQA